MLFRSLVPRVRDTLGSFLFPGDDVFKPVSVLSGGEKSRVALVKLLMRPANLLLLDEPTNHLDMGSKDILCEALEQYSGTVILVSHDRDFLSRLATHVLELIPAEATSQGKPRAWLVPGGYDYYLEPRSKFEEEPRPKEPAGAPPGESRAHEELKRRRNELRRIERKEEEILAAIEDAEKLEEQLQHSLAQPENYTNHRKAAELQAELEETRKHHRTLMDEWEGVAERKADLQEERAGTD